MALLKTKDVRHFNDGRADRCSRGGIRHIIFLYERQIVDYVPVCYHPSNLSAQGRWFSELCYHIAVPLGLRMACVQIRTLAAWRPMGIAER